MRNVEEMRSKLVLRLKSVKENTMKIGVFQEDTKQMSHINLKGEKWHKVIIEVSNIEEQSLDSHSAFGIKRLFALIVKIPESLSANKNNQCFKSEPFAIEEIYSQKVSFILAFKESTLSKQKRFQL